MNNAQDFVKNRQAANAGRLANELVARLNNPDTQMEPGGKSDADPAPTDTQKEPVKNDWEDKLQAAEQRYASLRGKYDAEVPRLNAEIKAMREHMARLEATISTATQPQQQTAQAEQSQQSDLLSEFDPDLARGVQQYVEASVKPLQSELQVTREELLARKQQEEAEQAFLRARGEVIKFVGGVETFEKIDKNPGFANWLDEIDPAAGVPRRLLMDEAFIAGRYQMVANFFKSWAQGALQPEASDQQQPQSLEEQLQPGRQGAEQTRTTKTGTKIWRRAEIRQFYDDVKLRKYVGRDAERKAIEKDISAAAKEGRVTS